MLGLSALRHRHGVLDVPHMMAAETHLPMTCMVGKGMLARANIWVPATRKECCAHFSTAFGPHSNRDCSCRANAADWARALTCLTEGAPSLPNRNFSGANCWRRRRSRTMRIMAWKTHSGALPCAQEHFCKRVNISAGRVSAGQPAACTGLQMHTCVLSQPWPRRRSC